MPATIDNARLLVSTSSSLRKYDSSPRRMDLRPWLCRIWSEIDQKRDHPMFMSTPATTPMSEVYPDHWTGFRLIEDRKLPRLWVRAGHVCPSGHVVVVWVIAMAGWGPEWPRERRTGSPCWALIAPHESAAAIMPRFGRCALDVSVFRFLPAFGLRTINAIMVRAGRVADYSCIPP